MKLIEKYSQFKNEAKKGLNRNDSKITLIDLLNNSMEYISSLERTELISSVSNKKYFAFINKGKMSRAINANLFNLDKTKHQNFWSKIENNGFTNEDLELITQVLYSSAISFCSAIDILKKGDQKTPGTFFEYFISYFFTWVVKIEPEKSIQILNLDDENTKLQTDFIFNLGKNKQKFHMPVKTSTRERAIMLWAHQKLIDGVYGTGRFMGVPVLLAETKVDSRKKEVIEICQPAQLQLYQLYIAKIVRIYYLDLPHAYLKLNDIFPPIIVKPFAEFFLEWKNLHAS